MRFSRLSLAVALLATPLVAQAQPFQGLYIGAGAGYNLPVNYPLSRGAQLQPHGGFVGLGNAGYALGNGFRFEVEGNYRQGHLGNTTFAGTTSGSVQTYGVLVNALFDIDVGSPWIYPYIGGGVGYAWTHLSRHSIFTPASFPLIRDSVGQTEGNFAFQAIGGLSFPIPGVPGLSLTTEYRFFGIPGSENFTGTQLVAGVPSPVPVTFKVQHQYNHSFLLGVRYAFNVAAPVPALVAQAAPAPAPARSYLVFFDWDKATLTDRARQVVKEAADNSTRIQYTRIEVSGYTVPRAPHCNQGLSVRRARACRSNLLRTACRRPQSPSRALATPSTGAHRPGT
jgi:opacity protein-like surface antigen